MQKNRQKNEPIFRPVLFQIRIFPQRQNWLCFLLHFLNSNNKFEHFKTPHAKYNWCAIVNFQRFSFNCAVNWIIINVIARYNHKKGRINSLFGSLILNMLHIDSSFTYFGSPKGSPKCCKRLVNMSAYLKSGNQITRN